MAAVWFHGFCDIIGATGHLIYLGSKRYGLWGGAACDPQEDRREKTRIMRTLISLSGFMLMLNTVAMGADIYITQNTSGLDTGANCANAHSAVWFNTSNKWNAGAGTVMPGDTVHLCGTFTFAANDSTNGLLRIGGSGTSGSPITVLFEPGAIVQSPQFSTNGGIMCHYYYGCHGYLVVDGGANGIIQNTANGTGLSYSAASRGLFISGYVASAVTNVEVKNLTIRNIYLNQGTAPGGTDTKGANTVDVETDGYLTNVSIHDSTLNNARTGVGGTFDGYTWVNVSYYNNQIADHCWGFSIAGLRVASSATNVQIYNHTITDWTNWQCPSAAQGCTNKTDTYHTDGIITYSGNASGTPIYAPLIYNNHIYGDLGNGSATAFIYCTVGNPLANSLPGSECIIFNNLLQNTAVTPHAAIWFGGNTQNNQVYNNTIIGTVTNNSFNPCWISSSLGGDKFQNNICATWSQIESTQWATIPPQSMIAASDYNVYYNLGAATIAGNGTTYTMSQWKALGFDTHSILTDPLLNSIGQLSTGSSAKGAGANLTSLGISALNSDKAGVTRPASGAWDIGAYQYSAASPTNLTVAVR